MNNSGSSDWANKEKGKRNKLFFNAADVKCLMIYAIIIVLLRDGNRLNALQVIYYPQ